MPKKIPATFIPVFQTIDIPVTGDPLTLCYLGQYEHLFDSPVEEPILTWTAISWLLKDYGLSHTDEMSADYLQTNFQTINVKNHPHFCPCLRRCI